MRVRLFFIGVWGWLAALILGVVGGGLFAWGSDSVIIGIVGGTVVGINVALYLDSVARPRRSK